MSIGGYFGLELQHGEHYHKNALRLNTSRNCFEYIIRVRDYKKVYIPYYTCEVMLEPLQKLGVAYEFYHIDESLEPVETIQLQHDEAFLYTNYFGLKQFCVERLSHIYGHQLIVDNAQAFYAKPIVGIDTFYSPRKFFGVADGGYLYIDKYFGGSLTQDVSYNRMSHLLKRIDISAEEGFMDFRANDDALDYQPIRLMSKLTDSILKSVDYAAVANKRKENYLYLDKALGSINLIKFNIEDNVPMVYPFLANDTSLKRKLIKNRIYVATYWPNVLEWTNPNMIEYGFATNIIAMPCDQRYDECDMKYIVGLINENNG